MWSAARPFDGDDEQGCRTNDLPAHAKNLARTGTVEQDAQLRDIAVRANLFVVDDNSGNDRIEVGVAQAGRATHELHQPPALTCLPPKMAQGAVAAVGGPWYS